MMTAAKIVETVPWIDAKYYASTQTMDEARHTEVFAKYLRTKLGDAYPMSPFLKAQIWSLLEDSRWDIAYLGMQIVIESLALAAFGDMLRRTKEPLLTKLLRYVMSDEARHVAFGVLTLSEFYRDLSEAELKERQEFLVDATLNRGRGRRRPRCGSAWARRPRRSCRSSSRRPRRRSSNPMRRLRPRLLRQARAQRAQARPARRQQRLPAREVGRGGAARVRVRRRHRLGLRVLRRRGRTEPPPAPAGGRRGPGGAGPGRTCASRCPRPRSRSATTPRRLPVRDKFFVMTSEDGSSMTLKAPKGVQAIWWLGPGASSCPSTSGQGWVGVRLDLRRPTGTSGRDDRRELLPDRAQAAGRAVDPLARAGDQRAGESDERHSMFRVGTLPGSPTARARGR